MKKQAPWVGKLFDEPRTGFVAEHGSQLHPLVKPPEPVKQPEPPPAPDRSPLDKIIDEDRLGFMAERRADRELRPTSASATNKPT